MVVKKHTFRQRSGNRVTYTAYWHISSTTSTTTRLTKQRFISLSFFHRIVVPQ